MKKAFYLFVLTALLAAFLPTTFAEEVTYTCLDDNADGVVSVDAAGGGECMTIQEAIDNATGGETIEVADGTYEENLSIDAKAVTLRSASDDPELTILDGSSSSRVIYINNAGSLTLQGVTVTKGYSDNGAGMYVRNSAVNISNCIFDSNNSVSSGAGISIYSPTEDVTIERSIFKNNFATGAGGGIYADYFGTVGLTIQNSLFYDNTGNTNGGALYMGNSTYPKIYNNTFAENIAGIKGGAAYLFAVSDELDVTNNIFYDNDANPGSGSAGEGDGVYLKTYFTAGTISYNNLYANDESAFWIQENEQSATQVGIENLSYAPSFTDVANNDYTLAEGSLLIDAGYDLSELFTEDLTGATRPLGDAFDVGAYEYEEEVVACTLDWTPVCGAVDEVYETYGNQCMADAAGATDITDGECVTDEEEEEEEEVVEDDEDGYNFCTLEWDPVCGEVDGIFTTYGNQCAADASGAINTTAGECGCGDFPDVEVEDFTDEQCSAITWAQDEEVFTGNDETGNLEPDSPINRAETTKVLVESFGFEVSSMPTSYSDVEDDAWYTPYIMAATENEIVEGYPDGTFKPADTVNKVEMLKIILETAEVDLSGINTNEVIFTDIPIDDSTEWFRAYAYYAYENNLLDIEGDEFNPNEEMLREDVILTLYRLDLL